MACRWAIPILAALVILSPACGGEGPTDPEPPLLEVRGITLDRINPVYPDRDPQASAVSRICQVSLTVELVHSNGCTSFGPGPSESYQEGNRFVFFVYPGQPWSRCGPPVPGSLAICLPNYDAEDRPLPPLPPGEYTVEANGVTMTFELP